MLECIAPISPNMPSTVKNSDNKIGVLKNCASKSSIAASDLMVSERSNRMRENIKHFSFQPNNLNMRQLEAKKVKFTLKDKTPKLDRVTIK